VANDNKAGAVVIPVVLGFLYSWLVRTARVVWEDWSAQLFAFVVKAEADLKGQAGLVRRDAVLAWAFAWLAAQAQYTWFQKVLLRQGIVYLVNGIIFELNDTLGHDWLAKAQELHEKIEDLLPWLDDRDDEGPAPVPAALG
jgi:hypothetical protein